MKEYQQEFDGSSAAPALLDSDVAPEELAQRLSAGEPLRVLDVRDPSEFEAEHIGGSSPFPLSLLRGHAGSLDRERPVVLVCRTGRRSAEGLRLLREAGMTNATQLSGGLEAWKRAKLPVERSSGKHVWTLERQVRFAAGALVLAGLLGALFWPPAIGLSWLVGAGLVFAAVTDTCAMGILLSKLPWNRSCPSACTAEIGR
jgi:rhodanese-related sulfurtransferase